MRSMSVLRYPQLEINILTEGTELEMMISPHLTTNFSWTCLRNSDPNSEARINSPVHPPTNGRQKVPMFVSLIIFAVCEDSCVAPLVTPAPVPNKELKFVQIMIRHGARSPIAAYLPYVSRGHWLCDGAGAYGSRMHAAPMEHYRRFLQLLDQPLVDYPPNCKSGDLTTVGMEQHHNLGQFYHKYLFENHQFFKSLPVPPEEIRIRCTDVERTFRSAESFLHGLFPPQSPNEIIEILGDTSDGSSLRVNFDWYEDARDVRDRWFATEQFQKWLDENWEVVKDAAVELGMGEKNWKNLNDVCDFVSTHFCSDKMLPSFISEAVIDRCPAILGNITWDLLETNKTVIGSYIVRELMKAPIEVVNGTSKVKFALMSSHDTSLAAVLVFLKDRMDHIKVPGFASHLLLELWKGEEDPDYTIRWVMNGEPVPLREMEDRTEVPFSDFLNAYSDMNKYCLDN